MTETMAVGRIVGSAFEKDRRFAMVVRTALDYQDNLDAVRALPLKPTLGQIVPLGDVAEVSLVQGPALVNWDKQSRRLLVEFNVRDREAGVVRLRERAVRRRRRRSGALAPRDPIQHLGGRRLHRPCSASPS